MTSNELRDYFNKTYLLNEWPKTFKVDADTYAQCCHTIFISNATRYFDGGTFVSLGPNGGPLFKNVELILEILPV